ncbi:MAG TPA: prolipoprotein diacylglyceryl transferase family protein [Smithellaceae bacterium]|nr:prolipoprotein diacylglyceryl transferase family protein [Smithellaceae bacterium]
MMLDEVFILLLGLAMACTFRWAFRTLPQEQWQMIGSIPVRRLPDGAWLGWNLTWYGFFNAASVLLATSLFLILMGSLSVPTGISLFLLFILLAACLPAARLMAYLVERKRNTFTVGGAFFVGVLLAPWIVWSASEITASLFGFGLSVMQTLAALAIAYALGEGVGRLACISFGCCYGKPLVDCSPWIQRLFSKNYFIFAGKTKKIAYAHQLDGVKVIPIQAVTAVIFGLTGLAGCYLFLKGFSFLAFTGTLLGTQVWRILSETLRADYRGNGRISAYQLMAAAAILYAAGIGYAFHASASNPPVLISGLKSLWDPALILFVLAVWFAILIYLGKSKMTAAIIHFRTDGE